MFYILSLTNIISHISPVHIYVLHFTMVYCILTLLSACISYKWCLSLTVFNCKICVMRVRWFVTSHHFYSIILTLFVDLLITKVFTILFHPLFHYLTQNFPLVATFSQTHTVPLGPSMWGKNLTLMRGAVTFYYLEIYFSVQ